MSPSSRIGTDALGAVGALDHELRVPLDLSERAHLILLRRPPDEGVSPEG